MLYESYLEALHLYNLQFRYKMLWQKHKDGYQLLAKENLKTGKREYFGRRSVTTEKIAADFRSSKQEIKERLKNLKEKLIRDIEQSKLVTKIILEYMPNIDIEKEVGYIKHISKDVVDD